MNILFITLARITNLEERSIYQDLLRKFRDERHTINIVSPIERRYNKKTSLIQDGNVTILNVKTPNIQKTNFLEKGIGTLILEFLFKNAIIKHYKKDKFDLIIYSTPPITFTRLLKFLKKQNNAKTYLLLKDIFPQNAVDLKMMSASGLLYKYFRKKELELYNISDWIGCMSEENKKYLLSNNPNLKESKIEVNPNSIFLEAEKNTNNYQQNFLNIIPDNNL